MMEQLISYQLVLNKSQADYLAASKYGINRMQALVSLLELVKTADEVSISITAPHSRTSIPIQIFSISFHSIKATPTSISTVTTTFGLRINTALPVLI